MEQKAEAEAMFIKMSLDWKSWLALHTKVESLLCHSDENFGLLYGSLFSITEKYVEHIYIMIEVT